MLILWGFFVKKRKKSRRINIDYLNFLTVKSGDLNILEGSVYGGVIQNRLWRLLQNFKMRIRS